MPFRISSEFLKTLPGSPQEWEELEVLAERSKRSKERFLEAISVVRRNTGTIKDMCFPLSLAFIDPASIEGFKDLNDLRLDSDKSRQALEKLAVGKRIEGATSAAELYTLVSRPDFIGGVVYIAGSLIDPNAGADVKHAALLIPGLGGITDTRPNSLAEVLSRIGYIRSFTDNNYPNAVLPSIPLREAEKIHDGEDLPLILLLFK